MAKPGYKTSEFWFTLVSFIFSGLFLSGVIKENDTKDELIDIVTHGVESIILISGQVVIFYRYLQNRKQEKIEIEKTKQKEIDSLEEELENYVGVDKKYDIININNAVAGELIQLPHIGPVTAKKIIEYRNLNKGFKDKKEIINISGVGLNIFEEIKNHISI